MPNEIHQIRGILAIVNCELPIESNFGGIFPEQPGPDRMERAGPVHAGAEHTRVRTEHLAGDAFDPPLHLGGRASGEGQQHDTSWVDPADDQMCDAVRERVCLSRTRACDNEQCRRLEKRRSSVLDGSPLLRI